jgi:hypothetical protein
MRIAVSPAVAPVPNVAVVAETLLAIDELTLVRTAAIARSLD